MSNRTDFHELTRELGEMFTLPPESLERIETELHNAHVAGQEGSPCLCQWCQRDPDLPWIHGENPVEWGRVEELLKAVRAAFEVSVEVGDEFLIRCEDHAAIKTALKKFEKGG